MGSSNSQNWSKHRMTGRTGRRQVHYALIRIPEAQFVGAAPGPAKPPPSFEQVVFVAGDLTPAPAFFTKTGFKAGCLWAIDTTSHAYSYSYEYEIKPKRYSFLE